MTVKGFHHRKSGLAQVPEWVKNDILQVRHLLLCPSFCLVLACHAYTLLVFPQWDTLWLQLGFRKSNSLYLLSAVFHGSGLYLSIPVISDCFISVQILFDCSLYTRQTVMLPLPLLMAPPFIHHPNMAAGAGLCDRHIFLKSICFASPLLKLWVSFRSTLKGLVSCDLICCKAGLLSRNDWQLFCSIIVQVVAGVFQFNPFPQIPFVDSVLWSL